MNINELAALAAYRAGRHVNKLRPLQHVGSEPISMHAMHADVFWEYDP